MAVASARSEPVVLIEADPYGGDLAIRLRSRTGAALPAASTVLTLTRAARTSQSSKLIRRYAQPITERLSVVAGHLAAEQVSGVADREPLAEVLARSSHPVVVDRGPLHGSSPVLPVAARADVVVAVARPDPASVTHLRERLLRLVPALASRRDAGPPSTTPRLSGTRPSWPRCSPRGNWRRADRRISKALVRLVKRTADARKLRRSIR